jgi:hypothetical protein
MVGAWHRAAMSAIKVVDHIGGDGLPAGTVMTVDRDAAVISCAGRLGR